MANQEHIDILKQGVDVWNKWREEHSNIRPDLMEANLSGANLMGANLSGANLENANLTWVDLKRANLTSADLINADLTGADLAGVYLCNADLIGADLIGADLTEADLGGASLARADLTGANLIKASLTWASVVDTNLTNANLTGCSIYGISVWNVNLEGAVQKDLVITYHDEPEITVDNLDVAQFIYLLLNNSKIHDVINTITSKVVLILGRFTDERKLVLDALRDELRNYNYSPVVFDFDPSAQRDLTETVSILAHLSRFVIADLTDTKSVPQELEHIIPHLPSVPIQPILHIDAKEYAMFEHYKQYPWVLPVYPYQDIPSLLASIKERIIKPVEQKEYEKDENKALKEKMKALEEKIKMLEERISN